MSKKQRNISIIIFVILIVGLLTGIILTGNKEGAEESIQAVMKDAVIHNEAGRKISFMGISVNPALISAFIVSAILIISSVIIRIFIIPKFSMKPGKFQFLIEKAVSFFSDLAKSNSPEKNKFMGAYIFTAGIYIFTSTVFELLGVQVLTISKTPIALPAPLADINGAIAMGVMSYGVILFGGLIHNGPKGFFHALKDFSLPISMSFRLFGALLSGALVTELVYAFALTSYVLPVLVGVMFTLLHALIQAYVLTMLVSIFYGQSTEKMPKKEKRKKQ